MTLVKAGVPSCGASTMLGDNDKLSVEFVEPPEPEPQATSNTATLTPNRRDRERKGHNLSVERTVEAKCKKEGCSLQGAFTHASLPLLVFRRIVQFAEQHFAFAKPGALDPLHVAREGAVLR